jgi:hypothetical protein
MQAKDDKVDVVACSGGVNTAPGVALPLVLTLWFFLLIFLFLTLLK